MLMITSGFENVLLVFDLALKKLHVFKQFVTLTWLNFLRLNYAAIAGVDPEILERGGALVGQQRKF